MKKVKIASWGTSSKGPWLLVEWEIKDSEFLMSKFLSAKAINPKWKAGDTIEVPAQLLR